jgi:hypothetical protein
MWRGGTSSYSGGRLGQVGGALLVSRLVKSASVKLRRIKAQKFNAFCFGCFFHWMNACVTQRNQSRKLLFLIFFLVYFCGEKCLTHAGAQSGLCWEHIVVGTRNNRALRDGTSTAVGRRGRT